MKLNKKRESLAIVEIPVIYQNVKYLIYQLKKEKDIKKLITSKNKYKHSKKR